MAEYNGHHCWNCWNVSLWIFNDEGLYTLARECAKAPSARVAATRFQTRVGATRTPDGARYTHSAVRAAMVEIKAEV